VETSTVESTVERRIRWASFLIGAGLLVQLGSLLVVHPLAFVGFLMVGCPLLLAGIVLYLLSLIHEKKPEAR
jgi:hypothetical protein